MSMLDLVCSFVHYNANMKKVQNDWQEVRDKLNRYLKAYEHGPQALAEAAGVNYFAARRYLMHGASNRNRTAECLCRHFGVELDGSAKLQMTRRAELVAAIVGVWDGSSPHAELLINLVQSTKAFAYERRHDKGEDAATMTEEAHPPRS